MAERSGACGSGGSEGARDVEPMDTRGTGTGAEPTGKCVSIWL